MVYIYPTIIKGTHHRSATYHTQQLSNPQALCSDNKKLAYWGVRQPTWKGNYLRNWPDSLTSKSGSYYTPDSIKATGFSVNADSRSKIKKISVEYKWEQISYSSPTAFGSFNKPIINLVYKGKNIGSNFGAVPEAIRYNNNKIDEKKINTDNAELSTLHSHTFDISSYDITVGNLKDIEVEFVPASNKSYNHLRIVMQFLRLNIDKEDYIPAPLCRVETDIDKKTALVNETFKYTAKIKTTNNQFSTTNCHIDIPEGVSIIDYEADDNTSFSQKDNIWEVRQLNEEGYAILKLNLVSNLIGNKIITTKILNNADSIYHTSDSSIDILDKSLSFSLSVNQNIFHQQYNKPLQTTIVLTRNNEPSALEKVIIDTDGLITDIYDWNISPSNTNIEYLGDGKWEIINKKNKLILKGTAYNLQAGDYTITARHTEEDQRDLVYTEDITVLTAPLSKEYFKLRVEDGSDVQYNSLMFTEGDDLLNPLTYELEDLDNKFINNLEIIGEKKKIPTGEARYVSFTLNLRLQEDVTYKNILTSIETFGNNDIIVGADDSINIFESSSGQKYFTIDEITSNKEKKIKFIVQSDVEREVDIKLKILNKDNDKWQPGHVLFKDIPNVKLNIENINYDSDYTITEENQGKFILRYSIQNLSKIEGKDIRFKIEEPSDFKTGNIITQPQNSIYDNDTKIWYFEKLEQNDTTKYYIDIEYTAQKSNIYDFILKTMDDKNTWEDDQYINKFLYKMYINIDMNIDVHTYVSKTHPYTNELFDFTINLKNYIKKQKNLTFQITDIGKYNLLHKDCDYTIEYVDCEYGEFTAKNEDNILGFWHLNNVDIDTEYQLTLSLRPTSPGTHVIHTTFINDKQESKDYNNFVKVYNKKNKIDFDVHHAICEDGNCKKCVPCEDLIEICDEDFVTLGDKFYYTFKVTNNDINKINKVNINCQMDKTFNIDCECPQNPNIHYIGYKNSNLYKINIDTIMPCSSITFCFRVEPTQNGIFYSNFILTTKDAHILSKTLKMVVNDIYTEKKLQHQITIHNFEKTHRYFRYELDGSNNIFKFFNTGDISKRLIETEDYNVNKVETFIGDNMYDLYRQIKRKSRYVDPELIRFGTNQLLDNGYELYPDGFIRRFGLLNSEVFHFAGHLPTITNLSRYAMRWDIDNWNSKLWAGDIYSNGVFDLTIDYDKIPSNFDIMQDTMNPIFNLQNIVEKTKPYGTKGICHYNFTSYIDLNIDTQLQEANILSKFNTNLQLDDIGLISWYNRDDKSLAGFYDMFTIKEEIDAKLTSNSTPSVIIDDGGQLDLDFTQGYVDVFGTNFDIIYIEDCLDIIQNKYYKHSDRNRKNIDITKEQNININDGDINNNTITGDQIKKYGLVTSFFDSNKDTLMIINDDITIEKINNGFFVKPYDEMYILFDEEVDNYVIQVENVKDSNINHLWVSINNSNEFYHFGYLYLDINKITVFDNTLVTYSDSRKEEERKDQITFKIKDTIHYIKEDFDEIYSLEKDNRWNNIDNINKKNKYASFENNIEIDKECAIQYVNVPPLYLKYNNIDIDNFDEITDISLKIKAHSNKDNFIDDLKINMYKNADYYIPNGLSSYINYPKEIKNINKKYTPTITIEEPNITLCSNCLHTNLGYYDECPDCKSKLVTHHKEKHEATVCYNCGYVIDGWSNRCKHCLSLNTEKIMVDYNKTHCNQCGYTVDKYYNECPHCFSNNIVHLQNDIYSVQIFDNDVQNINPIIIQSNNQRLNICNIYVPLSGLMIESNNIETLKLKIQGTNNNDGKYYYCPNCEVGGLGNYNKCPKCQYKNIENYISSNIILDPYIQYGSTIKKINFSEGNNIEPGEFIKTINIKDLALHIDTTDFYILLYVENAAYSSQKELKIDDEIIKSISKIDISIDNINSVSKYYNEQEWHGGTNALYGSGHTAITRKADHDDTEFIEFSNFDFKEYNNLENAFLYISGVNKTNSHVRILINILNDGKISSLQSYIDNGIFTFDYDILELIENKKLKDLKIQIGFLDAFNMNDISITEVNITTNKKRNDIITNKIKNQPFEYKMENNSYMIYINNVDPTLWGLNDTLPKYVSGKTLETGLLCLLDFGTLANEEYIKLYDIDLIINYKNKIGTIITKNIPLYINENDFQSIEGDLFKNNGDIIGVAKQRDVIINNLEYNNVSNTNDESTLNAFPIKNSIAQSFKISNVVIHNQDLETIKREEELLTVNNIGGIKLQYFGKVGYPSDNIHVYLCDDNNGKPGNILAEKWYDISNKGKNSEIWLELDQSILPNKTYWFVLEDKEADDNNYHRLRYNNNVNVGQLLLDKNGKMIKSDNYALSFGIVGNYSVTTYTDLPASWDVNIDDIDKDFENITNSFDIYNTLYKYNINKYDNTKLRRLQIKTGYRKYFSD